MYVCMYQTIVVWPKWSWNDFFLVAPISGPIHMSTNLANVVQLTSNFHTKKIHGSLVHIHTFEIRENGVFFVPWLKFEASVLPLPDIWT